MPASLRTSRESLLGLAFGVAIGLCGLVVIGLDTRFAVYGVIGLVGCALLPPIVRRIGSVEAFLFFVMVLSLQLDVAMAFAYQQKIAGPYGFLVSPILLAAAALLLFRLATAARGLAPRLVVDRRLVAWLVVFGLAGMVSVLNAPSRRLVAFGVFEIMTLGLIAIAAVDQCARPGGLAIVQRGLVATLVVQSVLILVSFTTGVQISPSHGVASDYGWAEDNRFAGTLNTPSAAATMLVVCLLLLVARLTGGTAAQRRTLASWVIGLGSFALLLTKTRTAWIGMAFGSAGIVWSLARRGELRTRRLLMMMLVGVMSLAVALPLIAQRFSAEHADDWQIRWRLVQVAAAMIEDHPLIGIGLNTATHQLVEYVSHTGVSGWTFIVHNQFLLVWAETGIFGIAAFVAFFWLGLRAASSVLRTDQPEARVNGAWLFWSLLALAWALNMDHVSGTATYKLVFLMLGAALGAARCEAAAGTSTARMVPPGTARRRAA
jgi:O-antigen ligase